MSMTNGSYPPSSVDVTVNQVIVSTQKMQFQLHVTSYRMIILHVYRKMQSINIFTMHEKEIHSCM